MLASSWFTITLFLPSTGVSRLLLVGITRWKRGRHFCSEDRRHELHFSKSWIESPRCIVPPDTVGCEGVHFTRHSSPLGEVDDGRGARGVGEPPNATNQKAPHGAGPFVQISTNPELRFDDPQVIFDAVEAIARQEVLDRGEPPFKIADVVVDQREAGEHLAPQGC